MTASAALKYLTYFLIASGTVFASQATAPAAVWDWVKLGVSALVAGCIAIKALESDSPTQTAKIDTLQAKVDEHSEQLSAGTPINRIVASWRAEAEAAPLPAAIAKP